MDFIGKINDKIEEIEKSKIKLEGDSFLFMGCWNKGNCNKTTNTDLYKTVESIQEYLTFLDKNNITKPEKLFIAGDNYYPDKTESKEKTDEKEKKEKEKEKKEKIKITNIDNLNSGFDCINSINIDKYILFGNHDFEKTILPNNDQEKNEKECHNLTKQLLYNDNVNKIEFFNFKSYCLPHIYKNENETLIVMIDSTMYDIKNGHDESLDCYKIINDNDNNDNMLEFIKNEQTRRAYNLIEYYKELPIKNIIFMAHHPIFGLKVKENKEKENELRVDCYEGLIELEMLFYNEFVNKKKSIKYYHFCADIHQFQVSKVTINNDFVIKQYIVGTGGAEKDDEINYEDYTKNGKPISKEITIKDKTVSKEITIKDETFNVNIDFNDFLSKKENGFMICNIKDDNVKCTIMFNRGVENLKYFISPTNNSPTKKLFTLRRRRKSNSKSNSKSKSKSKSKKKSNSKYYSLPISLRKSNKRKYKNMYNSI
jgi:hypothetical protein